MRFWRGMPCWRPRHPCSCQGALFLAAGMIYRIVRFRCLHCEGTVFPARFRRGLVIYCPKCGQPVEYL